MFYQYRVYYDGVCIGVVQALSETSARDKGCQLAGVGASAYSGRASRCVTVERV